MFRETPLPAVPSKNGKMGITLAWRPQNRNNFPCPNVNQYTGMKPLLAQVNFRQLQIIGLSNYSSFLSYRLVDKVILFGQVTLNEHSNRGHDSSSFCYNTLNQRRKRSGYSNWDLIFNPNR